MVYIQSWQHFQRQAEQLYLSSPLKTRYTVKWRSVEGEMVLKVTDDTTCLKYRTSSGGNFHRFLALNASLMERMQNRRMVHVATHQAPTEEAKPSTNTAGKAPAAAAGGQTGAGAATKGGKKSGKKKK